MTLNRFTVPIKSKPVGKKEIVMGSVHTAYCKCSFDQEVTVGGTMTGFGKSSSFPHYCAACGLVEVNIATRKGQKRACPTCKSTDVKAYGSAELSTSIKDNYQSLVWGDNVAMEFGNFCPRCEKMSLVFDRMPSILFD